MKNGYHSVNVDNVIVNIVYRL